ncbi:hypothetical protein [Mesorhizobium helmanticense]|uniref:hypothetical protein n=1 Tax=Mesorhizobium helmanticense TaxID=1776423 RepID=UPI0011B235B5
MRSLLIQLTLAVAMLSTTFSVEPNRLFSVDVGSEMPVDPANPKAADNRRVQLLNIGLVK